MPRRILITGIGSHWGTALAQRLEADRAVEAIVGVDSRPPRAQLTRTEFHEADLRGPELAKIMPGSRADTAVHCGIAWFGDRHRPAGSLHEINVLGTLQLLAACDRTPTLRSLVVRGSAAIYGAEPAVPAFLTEEMAGRFPLRTRFQRDIGELEAMIDTYARRNSHLTCCVLRYQPEIGPGLQSPVSRYLELPVIPTQLGFDPRLQLVHVDDATDALLAAVRHPIPGPVNVAPEGMISLTRITRLAGRPTLPVPHPLASRAFARLSGQLGVADRYEDAVRLLRYGRCLDTTRLRTELGFTCSRDAEAAVRDHVEHRGGRSLVSMPTVGDALARVVGS
ncbi:MAG: NAD-dependent epimerase/dehydratase family protein [Solirubrobacterales bacterium]